MAITQDDITFLSQLFCDYVQNTPDGKRTVLKLMNAAVSKADPRDAYFANSQSGNPTKIETEKLTHYAGWIYNDYIGVHPSQVEVEKNGNLEGCDATGILGPKGYCVQVVKEYGRNGREVLSSLSNYARLHNTDPNIRDTAKAETCRLCPIESCEYHPKREQQQQLRLIAPRGA